MKLTYNSPEEVLRALEEDEEETTAADEEELSTRMHDEDASAAVEEEVELEIDFDPPRPPILIRSVEDIPIIIGERSRMKNYQINASDLSNFLQRTQQQQQALATTTNETKGITRRMGRKITKLHLRKVHLIGGGCNNETDGSSASSCWWGSSSLVHVRQVKAYFCNINPNSWLDQLANQLPCCPLQSVVFFDVMEGSSSRGNDDDGNNNNNDDGMTMTTNLPNITKLLRSKADTLVEVCINNINLKQTPKQRHTHQSSVAVAVAAAHNDDDDDDDVVVDDDVDQQVKDFCVAIKQNCHKLKRLNCNSRTVGYTDTHIKVFANHLHCLEELELCVQYDVSLVPLAESLLVNTTKLRHLRVQIILGTDVGGGGGGVVVVDEDPTTTTTTTTTTNPTTIVPQEILQDEIVAFSKVLDENNVSLLMLQLEGWPHLPPPSPGQQQQQQQENKRYCYLARWQNACSTSSTGTTGTTDNNDEKVLLLQKAMDRIQFFIYLNRLGRERFLLLSSNIHRHQTTRGLQQQQHRKKKKSIDDDDGLLGTTTTSRRRRNDWIDIVLENQHDISIVFYFLRLNPSIYF